jgi:alkanesulfonate monooxygenase SsuD/methylene tetrahydromethanopterin reductase-like flavin-dependent oxidoreductase (luciferase family)
MTAKMAATLDFVSGGRLDFFFDPYAGRRAEADAYGLPAVDDDTALAQFEEAVHLIRRMWSEEKPSFQGQYYRIENAICHPGPVQQPSIPLWIGTSGSAAPERRPYLQELAHIIARHADWWNITPCSVETMRGALDLLRSGCAANGRDYGAIRKSFETQILLADSPAQLKRWQERIDAANPHYGDWDELGRRFLIGDVETVTRRLRDYADLGVECFMLWWMDYPAPDGLRLFAEKVMPYFRDKKTT